MNDFYSYGLRKELLNAIEQHGFEAPMEVQDRVLSEEWNNDLIVRAKTGSGKTLAFLLPLLQEMKIGERSPKVLVLAPTRELAQQTADEAEFLGKFLRISVASLVGGMDIYPQLRTLKHGAAIIAGTPGRVRDHIQRGSLITDEIESVVLDEGDLMLDMGFREELEDILNAIPKGRRWLFSATMPHEVKELASRYLNEPIVLSVDEEGEQHEDILHRVYRIPSHKRFEGLVDILLWEHPSRSLVFCHTKMESIEIAQRLQDHSFNAAALQGDMTQGERNAVLASFKSGSMPCLVATNVAARGLDIEGVSHVIQLGLPDDRETFIHRSGRTGRAGHEGVNIVLLSPTEIGRFREMLRGTQIKTEWRDIPNIEKIRDAWREQAEQDIFAAPVDSDYGECVKWASDLMQRAEPKVIIAKLLAVLSARNKGYSLDRELAHETEKRNKKPGFKRVRSEELGVKSEKARSKKISKPKGSFKKFTSSQNNKNVGQVLNALCKSLKVERSEVGAIRLHDNYILVELMPLALSRLEQGRAGLSKFGLYPEKN
ncbi:MAG: DEAD/DEAH box helicase [Synergistales bacterium]|nr:DEAD/DEAH box helicase [Synergistaceae bacterium]MDY6400093.1 DEAD/DEAH box helicase [Synergistales bacterium]MDY6401198.1 DEAD/DEAH box helicase [Synergistales bacterium]MDY6404791.1 DEAD/DEAH box helicase [Synergistales bacterium]MDY6410130.1 DEAD/DEAH box helicase [Synergistales bacterium]